MTTARELMTPAVSHLTVDATVAEAARYLAEEPTGVVPVCDADGRLRGMVSDRDLVVEVAAAGKLSGDTRLIDLIRGEVVTVDVDDSVDAAVAVMREHKVQRLPVVEGKKLAGIVSCAGLTELVSES